MPLKPCLTCGTLSTRSRCPRHRRLSTGQRGSTRAWRTTRAAVLLRDGHRCQLCGARAEHVDHVTPKIAGGSDHPGNLRATCAACNLGRKAAW